MRTATALEMPKATIQIELLGSLSSREGERRMTDELRVRLCCLLPPGFNVRLMRIPYCCVFMSLCCTLATRLPTTIQAQPPVPGTIADTFSEPFPDLSEDEADRISGFDQNSNLSDDPQRNTEADSAINAIDSSDSKKSAVTTLQPIGGGDEFSPISSFRPNTALSGTVPENTSTSGFLRTGKLSLDLSSGRNPQHPTRLTRREHFYHAPLYFEDAELERCGRSLGAFQPIISAAHFFGTVPLVPYKVAHHPPYRTVRALEDCPSCGRYHCWDNLFPQIDGPAALFEAAAITGLIYLIP